MCRTFWSLLDCTPNPLNRTPEGDTAAPARGGRSLDSYESTRRKGPIRRELRFRYWKVAASALVLTALLSVPVLASDTVTLSVQGEGRSASISSASLQAVDYSHQDQPSTGTVSLQVDDRSATSDGWNVTIMASDFTDGDRTIPASNFSITDAGEPALIEGAEVDPTGGPSVPASSSTGPLDTPRKVLQADQGFGAGVYDQELDVVLTVPGQTPSGEYTSTLTINITAGP